MPKKKKILHLITGLEIGGAEMMLLKTLPRMQDSFDNRVCCIRGRGPIAKKLMEAGVLVYFLDLKHPLDLRIIVRFRKVVREFQPDILVTYLIHADLFGRIFGCLFGIKKIICNQRGKLLQWEFLRLADRMTKCLVTKYIVQTKISRQELMRKLRIPAERIAIIPNAIDATEFEFELDKEKKRTSLGLATDDVIITCVSKLRRGKGHEYLLEAFEQLCRHSERNEESRVNKQPKLLIVGDGEQKEKLLKQVKNYKSKSSVFFLGNRNDIKDILRISDIFVLPTLGEGMSNAIMEAMASGLPVITTDIPENHALIEHEKTGILVPPKNTDALAQAVERLTADPILRKHLCDTARISIKERFDIPVVDGKMRKLLETI